MINFNVYEHPILEKNVITAMKNNINTGSDITELITAAKKYFNINHDYDIFACNNYTNVILSVISSFRKNIGDKPHVIVTSFNNEILLNAIHFLQTIRCIELTILYPDENGLISASDVKKNIKDNTCLISISYTNIEYGVFLNIQNIARMIVNNSKTFKIPFHVEMGAMFGKYEFNISDAKHKHIDILTCNTLYIHGPPNVYIILIKTQLINGFGLKFNINEYISPSVTKGCVAVLKKKQIRTKKLIRLRESFKKNIDKSKNIIMHSNKNYFIPDIIIAQIKTKKSENEIKEILASKKINVGIKKSAEKASKKIIIIYSYKTKISDIKYLVKTLDEI